MSDYAYYKVRVFRPTDSGEARYMYLTAAVSAEDHKRWQLGADGAIMLLLNDGERTEIIIENIFEMTAVAY